jgi:hypothetical protein
MAAIYLIGSLRNPSIPDIEAVLSSAGHNVFDDWWSAGPEADDCWQRHEKEKGRSYREALHGYHAECVCEFDKKHLDRCDTVVLVMPAGKSGHIELGYAIGAGKRAFVLFPDGEPERYDVMYRFAIHSGGEVCFSLKELCDVL